MKAWYPCQMLHRRGHEVIHIGVEGSDPECSEHVPVISRDEWAQFYDHPGEKFYAWMHCHYGKEGKHAGNGWYDVVIPNEIDPELVGWKHGRLEACPTTSHPHFSIRAPFLAEL